MYWLQSRFISFALLSFFIANSACSEELSGLLDGKRFIGHNGEQGYALDQDEVEEIIFQDGLFTSISCAPYNFTSSEYSTRVVGNTIHFEAVTESPSHGKISWQGTVSGSTAEMTFIWTKERWYWDTRREYWFKGVLNE